MAAAGREAEGRLIVDFLVTFSDEASSLPPECYRPYIALNGGR